MIQSYKDLIVWDKANRITHKVYDLTEKFPKSYLFDLTNQLRRAALSIPANIVEGSSSPHSRELLQFLNVAKRSLNETRYLLLFAYERKLITEDTHESIDSGYEEISKMIAGLTRSIKSKL